MESRRRDGIRLGFIGMGAMGSRMARRLLDAGYDLTVYNRTVERTQPLAEAGARVAESPAALAGEVDVILSSVANDDAVADVMYAPDGALASARPRTVIIEMSTVSPGTARRLFETARAKGVSVLDAPVSGSTVLAEQGTLVVLVGGEEQVFGDCRPILEVLGKDVFYMGSSGCGLAMKLCVNAMLGTGMQALAEAIALGDRSGIKRERFLKALAETGVVSPSQKAKMENVTRDEYPVAFPISLMFKDFTLIMQQALELSVPMPALAASVQMCAAELNRQQAAGIDEDFSSVVRGMQRMIGRGREPSEYEAT